MTRWLDPQPIDVPAALRDAVGGHPLVIETLARRGICSPDAAHAFLDPDAYVPASPSDLPDLDRAVTRLQQAIQRGERIAVWGDFDADGQTATAVLLESLRGLGADVVSFVPARHEGHGLHGGGLRGLIAGGTRLVLTCDTGVTDHAAVAEANNLGAEVIITDHHVPGRRLPQALAVVDPHRLASPGHPLSKLAGVGVAYQVTRALDSSTAGHALDIVALGTVADVAALTGDNRYLVQRGLEALRHTQRLGLQAICHAADLRLEGLTEEHISYALAPRLNALGRLADANAGVELLTTDDPVRARTLATEVEALNGRRQWLTKQITDAALAQIDRDPSLLREHHALVLSHATWPGGIVGIVAGRLAERFDKPAVLISAPEGQLARGSARSVPGLNLVEALADCASLLERFGGHAGAAGFSIEPERIPELRAALSRAVAIRADSIPERTLFIDAYVELPDLTLDLVAEIGRLAPYGPGNPALTLAVRDLRILSEATIGRTGEHRRVTVEDVHDRTQTVFWWQGADWSLPQGRFDLALTLRASDFRGVAEVQAEWIDARELQPAAVRVSSPRPSFKIRDYRAEKDPEAVLRAVCSSEEIQVWAEGVVLEGVESCTRQQLKPGQRLAILTLPPGAREFKTALARAQPEEVLLFSQDPGLDEPDAFLARLAGLIKYALRVREGRVDVEAVAAAVAHRAVTVEAGLDWLAAQGQVHIAERGGDRWLLRPALDRPDPGAAASARIRLDALLAETAAYRAYLATAPAPTLADL